MSILDAWLTLAPPPLRQHRVDHDTVEGVPDAVDDVVIDRPSMGRLEVMSDGLVWGCFYVDDEERRFSFSVEAVNRSTVQLRGWWEPY